MIYDCIIIGSGPSGLMAAIEASKKNKILIIEKNSSPGVKLLLTGNKRCNLTNLKSNNDFINEITHNKKYLYSTINKFGPKEIYDFFINNNVLLKEEEDNKIFPVSNKSRDILEALLNNLKGVSINYNETLNNIINENIKKVITNKNIYKTKNIIIALGGSSYPLTGSNGDNLRIAKLLKQPTTDIYPCETSIILKDNLSLAGTSIEKVNIKYKKYSSAGNLMFTHKGISGSAIMKLSEYIYLNNEKEIIVDFLPDITPEELLINIKDYDNNKSIASYLNQYFTKKFILYLLQTINIDSQTLIKRLPSKYLDNIINTIKHKTFIVKSTEDIKYSYITGGGIDMKYINTSTMESLINKGIYFVGESLDLHGPLGGYNITIALSTGYTAGSNINKKL
ncbi:MAG: aminoacetone oxidase family FAD-binding enzyme [Bacilli bacterium]